MVVPARRRITKPELLVPGVRTIRKAGGSQGHGVDIPPMSLHSAIDEAPLHSCFAFNAGEPPQPSSMTTSFIQQDEHVKTRPLNLPQSVWINDVDE